MLTHKAIRKLADDFEKAYPEMLPERLQWWCGVLGVKRRRFLQLLGMSPQEAAQHQDQDWEEILRDRKRYDRAGWVEGTLIDILSLRHYDWKKLAEELHQRQGENGQKKPARISGPQDRSSPDDPVAPLETIVAGGPAAVAALLDYLFAP